MNPEHIPTTVPTLALEGYLLRGVVPEDAEDLFSFLSDREVTRFTTPQIDTLEQVKELIALLIERFEKRQSIYWVIETQPAQRAIGRCHIISWNEQESTAEIGYYLAREYWNKGIMTRAIQAVARYGFETLEFKRIQATVVRENLASARVLEKVGFSPEGDSRAFAFRRGQYFDTVKYSISEEEFRHACE